MADPVILALVPPSNLHYVNGMAHFAISSAPKHFQQQRNELLTGLQGVLCQVDDILVFGKSQAEYNWWPEAVLWWIEKAEATLDQ